MSETIFCLLVCALLAVGILWRRSRERELQSRRYGLRFFNAASGGTIGLLSVFMDLVQNSEGYVNHYGLWVSIPFWIATANELFGFSARRSMLSDK